MRHLDNLPSVQLTSYLDIDISQYNDTLFSICLIFTPVIVLFFAKNPCILVHSFFINAVLALYIL